MALFVVPVTAASLQVSPIMLDIEQNQPSDGIWLSNTSQESLHAQVRVFAWSQQDREDFLEATPYFVASPPLIKIEAGGRQFIRLVRIGDPGSEQEQAYRIVVDELPIESEDTEGLTFVLRYSIPVFIQGKEDKQEPNLVWKITENAQKEVVLVVTNTGNKRAQLSRLIFTPTNGKSVVLNEGLVGYALANNTMHWVISSNARSFVSGGVFDILINGAEQQISVSGLE